jgi:hypothetical protein
LVVHVEPVHVVSLQPLQLQLHVYKHVVPQPPPQFLFCLI